MFINIHRRVLLNIMQRFHQNILELFTRPSGTHYIHCGLSYSEFWRWAAGLLFPDVSMEGATIIYKCRRVL